MLFSDYGKAGDYLCYTSDQNIFALKCLAPYTVSNVLTIQLSSFSIYQAPKASAMTISFHEGHAINN